MRERRPRASRKPDPTDVIVGHNIRILRLERRMSQSDLAERLGVTFQQGSPRQAARSAARSGVQKYERGMNHVGGGRLHRIADVFGVPIKELFRGAPAGREAPSGPSPLRFLAQPKALRLVTAFDRIKQPALRDVLVALLEAAARAGGETRAVRRSGRAAAKADAVP